ncbi:MAG TPA: 4-alpha-glucanotransferase [Polyangia bacterium]|nr:4-alpha-glucanotransferase [Polyangia bacterium]
MSLLPSSELSAAIRVGLSALGIERLVLAIHDASFPSTVDEDIGRGSPYGQGARALIALAAGMGFDGLQLGPQGDTSLTNPSPYDGALFSKSPLSIALATLAEDPDWAPLAQDLLPPAVAGRPFGSPDRTQYAYAWRVARQTVATLHARFRADAAPSPLAERFAAFVADTDERLGPDALFEALHAEHGTDDWRRWPTTGGARWDRALYGGDDLGHGARARRAELAAARGTEIERHLFGQFILDEQHRRLREHLARDLPTRDFALFGDLQIGISHRDAWSRRTLFRADYLMGAPPSRTNPAGQPWGYPVLDPAQYEAGGAALHFVGLRVDSVLAEFDGLRVDHPHGLVCPWVYAAGDPDPDAAVARGARLRCSPNLADHPALAPLAVPTPDQISGDPRTARYADDWVRELRADQVDRYGVLFEVVMSRVAARGRKTRDVVCEVLSTWPTPLRRVMARHGLGRFCVTQKADLARPNDVYRGENTAPRDWIMVGNHDTAPIWRLAEGWQGTPAGAARAAYLAERLMPRAELRGRLARWIAADHRHLCQAMFADLFVGPARRVSIFFADLFGLREIYNRPGLVDPENWSLRLPSSFLADHARRVAAGDAPNLPFALAFGALHRAADDAPVASAAWRLLAAARELTPALGDEPFALAEAVLSPAPA